MKTAVIPFSGFYESVHDREFDNAVEMALSDESGNTYPALMDRYYRKCEMRKAYESYTKAYAESFCQEFKITATFESLQSPREYNFTTDRIFVNIEQSEIDRLFDTVDKARFTQVCADMFTSRSGFISFYSPDWKDWGATGTWDHNQLSALIKTHVPDEFDQWAEVELMDDFRCNGYIEQWLSESDSNFNRIANVAGYLRMRESRK